MNRRNKYQFGWLERKTRAKGPDAWVYRYRETQPDGNSTQRSVVIGTVKEYPTESEAWDKAEHLRLMANPENPAGCQVTVGALMDRYIKEELPELRHSTGESYQSYLKNHIRPKWGKHSISQLKVMAIEEWLKSLKLAPKSRKHIHNVMRVLFNCAMRWEILPQGINPLGLVRVRGASKRLREPRILTIAECHSLLRQIEQEPFRTMVLLDMATGLRCSELLALKWCDFLWEDRTMLVRRAIVDGVVDEVKTKYSRAGLPLDPRLADVLREWRKQSTYREDDDWVFASPAMAGRLPYRPWGVQQNHVRPAAIRTGLGCIGWHALRHTYSSMLRANGEDLKVQQELLRHADIRTTMNVYTQAMPETKRQAHGRIVGMVLDVASATIQ